ncbi:hypothetical protein [Micromonospora sp. CPCC 205556]|uniref:hypothetical protein n=1 Tax=Micromonospora sp. CPCC 205556 TaxID=3122398 RepID=UPI002FF0B5B8
MYRRTAGPLTLLAVAALTAGCQSSGGDRAPTAPATAGATAPAGGTPTAAAEPTAAATPTTASAANTLAVCQAVDKLIVDASRDIARDSASATQRELTPEQLNGQLKGNLAELADDVRDQAARAEDPRVRAVVTDVAEQIDGGVAAKSPATWMTTNFVDIPPRLTRDCHV